jgi:hypothetical protein
MAKPFLPYEGPLVTREQAKALGLTRFFPGSRCRKAGHLSQRMMSNGGCNLTKSATDPIEFARRNGKLL